MAKILLASLKAILNWLGGARCRRQEAISEPYWTALTLTLVFVTFGISLFASRMCPSSQLQARSKGTEPQWLQTERWPNASMIGKDDLKCCTNPWTTSRTKPQCRARCRRKIRRPLGRHLATSFYATNGDDFKTKLKSQETFRIKSSTTRRADFLNRICLELFPALLCRSWLL